MLTGANWPLLLTSVNIRDTIHSSLIRVVKLLVTAMIDYMISKTCYVGSL